MFKLTEVVNGVVRNTEIVEKETTKQKLETLLEKNKEGLNDDEIKSLENYISMLEDYVYGFDFTIINSYGIEETFKVEKIEGDKDE